MAGSCHERHLLPLRHPCCGLRGCHYHLYVPVGPARHRKIGPLNFLFGTEWASTASEPKYGILPFLLSSIYGTLGASLIGLPVGLLTAVFLSKAAAPGVRNVVVTAVELLSGIPSVVFGLLGMQVLVPAVAKVFGKRRAPACCRLSWCCPS